MEKSTLSSQPTGASDHPVSTPKSNGVDNIVPSILEGENIVSPSDTLPKSEKADDKNSGGRSKSSLAWEYFEKLIVKGESVAECKKCKKHLKAKTGYGTTHLHKHARNCFSSKFRQTNMQQMILKKNANDQITNFTFDPKFSRDELTKMVVKHELPLRVVEYGGFRSFVASLQPLFKVPSCNTVKDDIMKMYEIEIKKTKKLIEENTSRVAITTDIWTADHQRKGYMVITAHFIDSSWKLQNRILRFIHVPAPYTSSALARVLIETLLEWNIENNVTTITLDNCSTNDAMIPLVLDKLDRDKLMKNGTLIHMRCCPHILNLIVKDGLGMISKEIEMVRDSVVYWTLTPKWVENFEEFARQVGVLCTKKLSLDCQTRWNSTYLMLKTALMYKEVFPRLQKIGASYTSLPNKAQWDIAQEICIRLSKFAEVTELFSGTSYVTANLYFPKICEIKVSLNKWYMSQNLIIKMMTSSMLEKFDKYWSVVHEVMGVAAVLDPRYQMTLLEYYFPQIYEERSKSHIDHIRHLCYDLVSEYQLHSMDKNEKDDNDADYLGELSEYDSYVNSQKRCKLTVSKNELDGYLEEFVLCKTDNFDILLWWKMNELKYPILHIIARDVLYIPVSSVASESAFSAGGRIINTHRSRLHPGTLEALMCLRNWLREAMSDELSNILEYASIVDDIDLENSESV